MGATRSRRCAPETKVSPKLCSEGVRTARTSALPSPPWPAATSNVHGFWSAPPRRHGGVEGYTVNTVRCSSQRAMVLGCSPTRLPPRVVTGCSPVQPLSRLVACMLHFDCAHARAHNRLLQQVHAGPLTV